MKIKSIKKLGIVLATLVASAALLVGCGKKEEEEPVILDLNVGTESTPSPEIVEEPVEEEEEVYEEFKEGMYRSELTNEWIDEGLKNQRPVAVMVDNEITAWDHYGVNQGDIVYELMNSTANGRITRLMVIIKDWKNIERLGSIRSTRPTNVVTSWEYNAILIHDGGPFYINDYIANNRTSHLSGGFARYSNGKATEFTEYVTYNDYNNPTTGKSFDGLQDRITNSKISEEYTDNYMGKHFAFAKGKNEKLKSTGKDVTEIALPFDHTSSKLKYNSEKKKYEYYAYGKAHIDPMDDNNITCFENVILLKMNFHRYDEHGYMTYLTSDHSENTGYYISEGKCIPVKYYKGSDTEMLTIAYEDGTELELNTGKTYISYIPSDTWTDLELK